jgi:hypothetical protein
VIGVLLAERLEGTRLAGILERAAGRHIGQQNRLRGRQDLGDFRHEAHAAKHDDIRVGGGRLARQVERVADEVGDILDFAVLIIVRQDHGVLLTTQAIDLGQQVESRIDILDCQLWLATPELGRNHQTVAHPLKAPQSARPKRGAKITDSTIPQDGWGTISAAFSRCPSESDRT